MSKGTLKVTLKSGSGLRDTSNWSDRVIDPYVKIQPQWFDTKDASSWFRSLPAQNAGVDPVFDETAHETVFSFRVDQSVVPKQSLSIVVECYDKDRLSDDLIGSGVLNVASAVSAGQSSPQQSMAVNLLIKKKRKDKNAGILNFDVEFQMDKPKKKK